MADNTDDEPRPRMKEFTEIFSILKKCIDKQSLMEEGFPKIIVRLDKRISMLESEIIAVKNLDKQLQKLSNEVLEITKNKMTEVTTNLTDAKLMTDVKAKEDEKAPAEPKAAAQKAKTPTSKPKTVPQLSVMAKDSSKKPSK